jgi:hypothetical protein
LESDAPDTETRAYGLVVVAADVATAAPPKVGIATANTPHAMLQRQARDTRQRIDAMNGRPVPMVTDENLTHALTPLVN